MHRKINLLIAVTVCLTFFTSLRPIPETGIRLTITNLRNDRGFVLISLYKDGTGYPDDADKAYKKDKVAIYNKRAVIIFPDAPAGSYAVAILHDENNDQKMNKNGLGLPKEGYGFSNNVVGAFGPPSYRRSSFQHAAGGLTEISIKARY